MLVGEQLGKDLGGGYYRFDNVAPDAHRLLAYADYGDVFDDAYVTAMPTTSADLQILLDLCIETRMTRVVGQVRDARGKPVKHAGVAVHDLFLYTKADAKGRYKLELPPGTWEVMAWSDGGDEDETFVPVTVTGPDDPGGGAPVVELDITIE